ncbi:MAG: amidohydrolase [bacterium]
MMSSLLIKNTVLDGKPVNTVCDDGRITSIGANTPDVDTVLDAHGMIAFPPLINSHTHSSMTLFRGNGDDLPLMEWLTKRVWPYEAGIRKEEIYWGAKLAILEMIRAGTVFFNDMYWDFPTIAQAVEEMGSRAMLATAIIDIGNGFSLEDQIRRNDEMFKTSRDFSDRVQFAVGPHSIYTVSEKGLRWAKEFADEHGIVLHTHLAETEQEVKNCYNEHQCSPTEYLDRMGVIDERLVAAHTVWLSDSDIATLGEKKAVCVHNPVSNMKLAVNGVYPYRKLRDAGAVTAIATDGAGTNNNLDLFEEMKIAALLQKFAENDQTALPAAENLAMATSNPAPVFGLEGGVREGGVADLILLDTSLPEMNPPHDLASHLVYAVNGNVVDTVVCNGKILMKHRVVEGAEEIIARANEASRNLFARVDNATRG